MLYKGLQVGNILGYRLSEDKQSVELVTFIEDPYSALVQENTRFWDAGGVSVNVTASGIEVGADSCKRSCLGQSNFCRQFM